MRRVVAVRARDLGNESEGIMRADATQVRSVAEWEWESRPEFEAIGYTTCSQVPQDQQVGAHSHGIWHNDVEED